MFTYHKSSQEAKVRVHHPANHISAKYIFKMFEILFMCSRNQSESMDRKKKTCKERKGKVIKGNTSITDITVVEALRSLIPPHCCNFLCSIPNVAHDCAQRLRSRVRVLGLSEKKKKK